jgi:hypothetical protein
VVGISPSGYGGFFNGMGYFSDNLGIGTETPTAKLTVAGGILRDGSTTYGTGADTHINLGTTSTTGTDGQNNSYATVSGGVGNTAGGGYGTVGGGNSNTASHWYGTISGGGHNTASALYGTIGGGNSNTASGSTSTTVGGGWHNTASGSYGTVPGGYYNSAGGSYSFAAGRMANASHDGTFVWADSNDANFVSTGQDQFLIRAGGGVGIGTESPTEQLEVSGTVKASSFVGDGSGLTGLPTPTDSDWTIDGNDMYSSIPGNVGIGTASPDEKLTVEGGTIKASISDSKEDAIYGIASGSDGSGVVGSASGINGRGVIGVASNTDNTTNHGGYFVASGRYGRGVYGHASDTLNGTNYGGYFVADNTTGRGVYGEASSLADARNYGGYFVCNGQQGFGVYGTATGSSQGVGVKGYVEGSSSKGVSGQATGTYGNGVHGLASGTNGRGVHGWANDTGNVENYGGYFDAAGGEGRGVYGVASNSGDANNYGGYFVANGRGGIGVYGYASNTYDFAYRYGGWFEAQGLRGIGVFGKSNGNDGVGVYGSCIGINGYGVRGTASSSGTGVYGNSYNGKAIHGESSSGWAGYFEGNVGIQGGLLVYTMPYGDRSNVQWDNSTGLFFYDNSSKRFKENIKPIKDDFSKILNVAPKTYTRPGDPDRWEVGYIAEEFVEAGLEKLVWFEDEEHTVPEGINYEKVVLYTNEIVKEHHKTIHALHTQIDEQRRQIEGLLQRIEAIEGADQPNQFPDATEIKQ